MSFPPVRLAFVIAALVCLASPPALSQNASRGQSLYNQLCVSCHGSPPAGGPERINGDPARIRAAVNGGVPAMSFLRDILRDPDYVDIAAWLATLGRPTIAVPAFDFTDLWWGGDSESGWGLNIIQHATNIIFAVMYTYDTNNRPLWLVIPAGTWSTPLTYTGAIYRVRGPAFNAQTFNPALVNVEQLGIATLAFRDRDNGTFSFSINNGAQVVTKNITRQPF